MEQRQVDELSQHRELLVEAADVVVPDDVVIAGQIVLLLERLALGKDQRLCTHRAPRRLDRVRRRWLELEHLPAHNRARVGQGRLDDVADCERPVLALEVRREAKLEGLLAVHIRRRQRRLERQQQHTLRLGEIGLRCDDDVLPVGEPDCVERRLREASLAGLELVRHQHDACRPPLLAPAQRHVRALLKRHRLGVRLADLDDRGIVGATRRHDQAHASDRCVVLGPCPSPCRSCLRVATSQGA